MSKSGEKSWSGLDNFRMYMAIVKSGQNEDQAPVAPPELASSSINEVYRVAKGLGGFVMFFVANDGLHSEQHKIFCEELGLDDGLYPRSKVIHTGEDTSMVLRRELGYSFDDRQGEFIHGISYFVEQVPHDRD